jgi:hypothetical protein
MTGYNHVRETVAPETEEEQYPWEGEYGEAETEEQWTEEVEEGIPFVLYSNGFQMRAVTQAETSRRLLDLSNT